MSRKSGKARNRKETSPAARILISLVGVAMILLGLSRFVLFFVGDKAVAQVTTRRVGGSSTQYSADKRYEWSIDYTFMDKDGEIHDGHTTRRGSDMGVKVEKTVYYLAAAPFVNGLASEVEPNLGQLVLVGLGVFLLFVMNRRPKRASNPYRSAPGRSNAAAVPAPVLNDYDDSIEEVYHEVAHLYCTNCGAPLPANGRFCTNCGTPVAGR